MECAHRIREVLSDKSLSINDLSEKIGVSKRTIENYLGQKRLPGPEFLTAMTEHLGVSATWLLTGKGMQYLDDHPNGVISQVAPDFISIQRFDVAASAGHGALAETEIGTGHYAFNRTWLDRRGLKPDNLAVIAVRGDSMEPELYDQDLILLDRSQTRPRDGDMYVVRYSGDLFVKRIQAVPGNKIELLSTNRFYNPIMIALPENDTLHDLDLTFIGKVVASIHEW